MSGPALRSTPPHICRLPSSPLILLLDHFISIYTCLLRRLLLLSTNYATLSAIFTF